MRVLWRYDGLGYLDGVAKVLLSLSYLDILNRKTYFCEVKICMYRYITNHKLTTADHDGIKEVAFLRLSCNDNLKHKFNVQWFSRSMVKRTLRP